MAFGVRAGVSIARSRAFVGDSAASSSIYPWAVDVADATRNFPELNCIRPLLAADVLGPAEQRATAVSVGADRVLIASGALSEETYLRALGDTLGVAFEPLDGIPRALCPINDERLIESAAAGLLPLAIDDDLFLVVAPRGTAARQILRLIEENPARAQRFRFTSAKRLNRFVLAMPARRSSPARQTGLRKHGRYSPPPRRAGAPISFRLRAARC